VDKALEIAAQIADALDAALHLWGSREKGRGA
jgi:hypothetical protein